jgi:hypothetical protein
LTPHFKYRERFLRERTVENLVRIIASTLNPDAKKGLLSRISRALRYACHRVPENVPSGLNAAPALHETTPLAAPLCASGGAASYFRMKTPPKAWTLQAYPLLQTQIPH